MNQLKKKYQEEVTPKLMEDFGLSNKLAVPGIEKVSINLGLSRAEKEATFLENVKKDLRMIAGQAPVVTKARKAISGFKIRAGQNVGMMVTLRGEKMWDFLYRLVAVALPRTRDFRGISQKNFDQRGNLSLGIKEQLIFPEIISDETDTIFGFQINITTTAKRKEEGIALLRALGFPIQQ